MKCKISWMNLHPISIEDRFHKYTGEITPSGCIPWTGSTDRKGYGKFCLPDGKMVIAPRASWELANGPIPDGLFVCHKCDNPICVNIDHLFLGTPKDNTMDAKSKGRLNHGEKCHLSKLTSDKVLEIRNLHGTGKYTQAKIAEMFNVSVPNINLIVKRISWNHI
jgi:hypothetical protein